MFSYAFVCIELLLSQVSTNLLFVHGCSFDAQVLLNTAMFLLCWYSHNHLHHVYLYNDEIKLYENRGKHVPDDCMP